MNTWTPVTLRVPNNSDLKIVQAAGYPDPLIGWYNDGKWFIEDKFVNDTSIDIDVVAWRDFPPCEDVNKMPRSFRSINEARYLTMLALDVIKRNDADKDFQEVRGLIYSAVTRGLWTVDMGERPQIVIDALKEQGYHVDGTKISWM